MAKTKAVPAQKAEPKAVEQMVASEPLTASLPNTNKTAASRDKGVSLAQSVNDAVTDIENADASDRDPILIRALHDTLRDIVSRLGRYVTA